MAAIAAVVLGASGIAIGAVPAAANTSVVNNVPYSCTTNVGINQPATYSATITDTVDPAAVGQSVTYRFVVPFAQAPPPVTATYKGGTVTYPIPVGLTVTAVSTPPKAGSNLTATAAVQGGNIVVTSTGNQPIDGGTYPTPDLIVTGTVGSAAAGVGVVWRTPSRLVANVDAQIVGAIVATCLPNNPATVIATTTVPGAPQGPKPVDQTVAVTQGAAKAITLSATDIDTPAAQITYAVTTQPAHGVLTGTVPNLTFTAASNFVGNDTFNFTARDPQGNIDTGTITIRVLSYLAIDNTPPVVTITAPSNGAVLIPGQVVKAAFACSDTTTAAESCVGSQPNGANVSTTVGVHTLTVDAVDTKGNQARQTVSYRVISPTIVQQNFNATNTIPLACDDALPGLPQRTVPAIASAPTQVGTGLTYTMRFAPGPRSAAMLRTLTNITFTLAAPVNGTAISAALVPGTGTANATAGASATVSAGKAVLTVPGPIAGGNTAPTSYTPPAIDVTIRAATTPNAVVQTTLAQYKETEAINGVPQVPLTHTCTAGNPANGQPNPVLTRTTIIDTTPPTIALTAPAKGGLYGIGAVVPMAYTCTGATTCVGTVANGANIPTSTAGLKVVSVLANDAAGNVAQQLVSLRVVQTSFTTRYATSELPLLDEAAAYLNTDRSGFARYAIALLGYMVSGSGPPVPPPSPPANNGPVAVVTAYTPAEGQMVSVAAALFGMNGDQLHRYGASVLMYMYDVTH